jgi:hypothetical protein
MRRPRLGSDVLPPSLQPLGQTIVVDRILVPSKEGVDEDVDEVVDEEDPFVM